MQSDKQLSTFRTWTPVRKQPIELALCFDLQQTILIVMERYKNADHHDKVFIKKSGLEHTERYKKAVNQYKTWAKEGLDDFGQTVVNTLF